VVGLDPERLHPVDLKLEPLVLGGAEAAAWSWSQPSTFLKRTLTSAPCISGLLTEFVAAQAPTDVSSEITDFDVGQDKLDLSDFLKGQHLLHNSHPAYSDVVHLTATVQGTMVSVLAGGAFHDLVVLDGVHNVAHASDLAMPFSH
jgi:hypothetical protein